MLILLGHWLAGLWPGWPAVRKFDRLLVNCRSLQMGSYKVSNLWRGIIFSDVKIQSILNWVLRSSGMACFATRIQIFRINTERVLYIIWIIDFIQHAEWTGKNVWKEWAQSLQNMVVEWNWVVCGSCYHHHHQSHYHCHHRHYYL
jgi:hypothetical protein